MVGAKLVFFYAMEFFVVEREAVYHQDVACGLSTQNTSP